MNHTLDKYLSALNQLKEGIITMDTDFKITYSNPATVVLLNLPPGKIIGSNGVALLRSNNGSCAEEVLHHLASNALPFIKEVILPMHGKVLNATFIKLLEGGRYIGSLVIIQDITGSLSTTAQLRKLHEELNELQHQLSHATECTSLGQSTAMLSHEINTSLTIILGYSSLVLSRMNPLDPLTSDLKIIQEEVLRLCTITRSVLTLTHPVQVSDKEHTTHTLHPLDEQGKMISGDVLRSHAPQEGRGGNKEEIAEP